MKRSDKKINKKTVIDGSRNTNDKLTNANALHSWF